MGEIVPYLMFENAPLYYKFTPMDGVACSSSNTIGETCKWVLAVKMLSHHQIALCDVVMVSYMSKFT